VGTGSREYGIWESGCERRHDAGLEGGQRRDDAVLGVPPQSIGPKSVSLACIDTSEIR